jgi:type IV secretory pathway VirB2 component (pilin)
MALLKLPTRGLDLRLIILAVLLVLGFASEGMAATDDIFGTKSPFNTFVDFVTGPLAYFLVIIGVAITGVLLLSGNDFSPFMRRVPMLVVAAGFVLLAGTVMTNLFGVSEGALAPASLEIPQSMSPHEVGSHESSEKE